MFTYICNSIGEELNVNRFDKLEDNDLHEAVCKYNNYKKVKNNISDEPFKTYFESDKKFKAISISSFKPDVDWTIENWWSEQEKIDIGLKRAKEVITIDDFQNLINETIKLMNSFKEELECLK